jgi:hypothetical protein
VTGYSVFSGNRLFWGARKVSVRSAQLEMSMITEGLLCDLAPSIKNKCKTPINSRCRSYENSLYMK